MKFNFFIGFSLIFLIGVPFILFVSNYLPTDMQYIRVLLVIILISIPPILSNSIGLEKIGKMIYTKIEKHRFLLGYIITLLFAAIQTYILFFK